MRHGPSRSLAKGERGPPEALTQKAGPRAGGPNPDARRPRRMLHVGRGLAAARRICLRVFVSGVNPRRRLAFVSPLIASNAAALIV